MAKKSKTAVDCAGKLKEKTMYYNKSKLIPSIKKEKKMKNELEFTITNVHLCTLEPKGFLEDKNAKSILDGLTLHIAKFEGVFADKLRIWRRTLFCVREVNNALGYSNTSLCERLKGIEGIEIGKIRYSDSTTICRSLQKNKKNDLRSLAIKQFFIKFSASSNENKDDFPSFEEIKQYLTDSRREKLGIKGITLQTLGLQLIYHKYKRSAVPCAKQVNGKQMSELLKTVRLDNDKAIAFDAVSDNAKEITRYCELIKEGVQLTNEMSDIRVQIETLTEKLKSKEAEFERNQKEILEIKQSLSNNPLLKFIKEIKK